MNWATPSAPAGLRAVLRNRLSCHMTRVRKADGRPLTAAAPSTMRQIRCRIVAAVLRSGSAACALNNPIAAPRTSSVATAIAGQARRSAGSGRGLLEIGCRIGRPPANASGLRDRGWRSTVFSGAVGSDDLEIVLVEAGGGDALQQDGLGGVEGDQGAGAGRGGIGEDGRGVGGLGVAQDDRVLRGIETLDGVLAEADLAEQKGGRSRGGAQAGVAAGGRHRGKAAGRAAAGEIVLQIG